MSSGRRAPGSVPHGAPQTDIPVPDWRGGRPRRALRLGFIAAAALLLAASAGAAAEPKVLLIGPSASDPTLVRVQQELVLLGVEVEVTAPDPAGDPAELARQHGAAAVARVERSPLEIVLWVDGAHSVGVAQETRVSESLSGRAEPGLLALRAVELLRGRLLPVPGAPLEPTAPAPTAGASTAPGALPPSPSFAPTSTSERAPPLWPTPLPPSRGSLHIGPALTMSPGGVPVAPSLRIGGGLRVIPFLELGGLAVVPLIAGTVSAPEGAMDLRVLAIAASATIHFTGRESPLALRAGGGAGLSGFFYEGRAVSPWVSASGVHWAALPFIEAGAGYRFTPVLALRADVLAAIARPEPVLVIAGRATASFGTPAMFTSIALEIHP